MTILLFRELSETLIGCAYEVHNELKGGHLEATYRNALVVALGQRGISARKEQAVDVYFRGVVVGHYRMDLVIENQIVVECKTAKAIDPVHVAQLLNYLHTSRIALGFVMNFSRSVTFKRLVYDARDPSNPRVSND